jgi:hypothetical protein
MKLKNARLDPDRPVVVVAAADMGAGVVIAEVVLIAGAVVGADRAAGSRRW